MERLTKERMIYLGEKFYESKSSGDDDLCIDKLGQLEDIEQELGIDLIKFCKNYRELLSLKGRNLKISIEELQKELEK